MLASHVSIIQIQAKGGILDSENTYKARVLDQRRSDQADDEVVQPI